jgi:hypothetical protein
MKRQLLAVILLLPALAFAQSYTFSMRQEPYQKLQHVTAKTPPGILVGGAVIRMGLHMPFYFFGHKMDTIVMVSSGFMVATQNNNPSLFGITPCAAQTRERYPNWADKYASTLGMKIDTVNNKRITKLEYNNMGFIYPGAPDTTNFFNTQVWLYEDSNIIEFHYGPSLTDAAVWFQTYDGPYVSIDSAENSALYNITGSSTNPVISSNNDLNLDVFPANGTVYRFTPTSNTHTGVKELNGSVSFNLYPNPAKEMVTVSIENIDRSTPKVILMDIQGRMIKVVNDVSSGQIAVQLPLNDVPAGIYFVKVETASGTAMRKLLVQ